MIVTVEHFIIFLCSTCNFPKSCYSIIDTTHTTQYIYFIKKIAKCSLTCDKARLFKMTRTNFSFVCIEARITTGDNNNEPPPPCIGFSRLPFE